MRFSLSKIFDRHRASAIIMALAICAGHFSFLASEPEIYDIEAAKSFCDSTALEEPEGIWIYPDDGVTVLITHRNNLSPSSLPEYDIRVVDSSDVRLHPGDVIGKLSALPERKKFEVSLFTERGAQGLLKPKTILATLGDEGETLLLKKEKSKFNLRFTFNPSILLPKLWRVVRTNSSMNTSPMQATSAAVGLVKIYPSYDGNGSSRRKPRYL